MFKRIISLTHILERKSVFLFGPRQTGKSSFIRSTYPEALSYNLLEVDTFRTLSRNPQLLRQEITSNNKLVVIDEVQLLPELLNEVQLLIEERQVKFILTGSSARKLRRKGVNLLGGRATWKQLYPLVSSEIGTEFDLNRALSYGLLPSIYLSSNPTADLKDYIELYLREEIANETSIRQLPAFSRFLDIIALNNGQLINYNEVGNDAQVAPTTVREYCKVLEDTLIISRLPSFKEVKKRKPIAKEKFYFFDIGVARYLQGRSRLINEGDEFGNALESLIYQELRSYCSYITGEDLTFWRTTGGLEVDFLLSTHTAIEVKSTTNVTLKDLKGLLALKEEGIFSRYLLISRDNRRRIINDITVIPVKDFFTELWSGAYASF
jgi:uncharacterized protein